MKKRKNKISIAGKHYEEFIPSGKLRVIDDFLPKPEELFFGGDNVKVTLNLSKKSINSLKKLAIKEGTPYQKIIRNLVDRFVYNYQAS